MKSYILPVIALILGGVWVAYPRRGISSLEDANALLQKDIITTRNSNLDTALSRPKSVTATQAAKTQPPLDWEKIASQLAEMRQNGGTHDYRTSAHLDHSVESMSKEKLVAALNEIAALDLPAVARAELEQKLIRALLTKDPEFALTRYTAGLYGESDHTTRLLSHAMEEWAKKDLAKATTWLDQQIAAGKFDGKSLDGNSLVRNQFEGALISALFGSDPDAASRRLGALPEEQRGTVLADFMSGQLGPENQVAFAKIVREQLPEKYQVPALASQARELMDKGSNTKVDDFMDRIAATPSERAACVEQVVASRFMAIARHRKITRADFDPLREWAKSHAPDSVDSITGKTLGILLMIPDKANLAAASDLAVQYHEISGNDDVLTSFLRNPHPGTNNEQARLIAAKITDPKRREEILKQLQSLAL